MATTWTCGLSHVNAEKTTFEGALLIHNFILSYGSLSFESIAQQRFHRQQRYWKVTRCKTFIKMLSLERDSM